MDDKSLGRGIGGLPRRGGGIGRGIGALALGGGDPAREFRAGTIIPSAPSPTISESSTGASLASAGRGLGRGIGALGRGIAGLRLTTETPMSFDKSRPHSSASTAFSSSQSQQQESPSSPAPSIVKKFEGTGGKPCKVDTNYLELKTIGNMSVFEYHVDFHPQVDSKDARFRIISSDPVIEVIGRVRSFDGSKLYLPVRLERQATPINARMPNDGAAVTINIRFVKHTPPEQRVHLYNTLFKRVQRALKFSQVGRNYYDSKSALMVPQHQLEIWPGQIISVCELEGGLLLNADASFRVLRNVTAYDVLCELQQKRGSDFKSGAIQELVGHVALTRYNNKTYRIDDIDWDSNPMSSFETRNGPETFQHYYKRAYDITIQDTHQPLLVHNPKVSKDSKVRSDDEPLIKLVPELCHLTGLTDEMRSNFRIMKDIAQHTRVGPAQRQLCMLKLVDNINKTPEAKRILADWGVELTKAAVSLEARVLNAERILLQNKSQYVDADASWERLLNSDKVISAISLNNWLMVYAKRDEGRAMPFLDAIMSACPRLGMAVVRPMIQALPNDSSQNYLKVIRQYVGNGCQIVLIIFPSSRDDRYSAVKRLCCVDMPIPSQVVNAPTLGRADRMRSVAQKVALQMNCKMGGEAWAVDIPMKLAMVIGMDVYHDSTQRTKSVLGFVASANPTMTRWFSRTVHHDKRDEIASGLKMLTITALDKFRRANGALPTKIIVFRDGVGDGQLNVVEQFETEQIRSCFDSLEPGYLPQLSVVVVQKRINTRIFARINNNLDNPLPGTVLDHTVTRKQWEDFFLVSQKVRQGTVTPTHYVVVYNNSELGPNELQKFAYKMTHMYYNWPGTIRVPAPCQYAHRLAQLVGENLHTEPNSHLSDKLFFL